MGFRLQILIFLHSTALSESAIIFMGSEEESLWVGSVGMDRLSRKQAAL